MGPQLNLAVRLSNIILTPILPLTNVQGVNLSNHYLLDGERCDLKNSMSLRWVLNQ
jgi:hypothetical protein